jgi:hypothetical protein
VPSPSPKTTALKTAPGPAITATLTVKTRPRPGRRARVRNGGPVSPAGSYLGSRGPHAARASRAGAGTDRVNVPWVRLLWSERLRSWGGWFLRGVRYQPGPPGRAEYHRNVTSPWSWPPQRHIAVVTRRPVPCDGRELQDGCGRRGWREDPGPRPAAAARPLTRKEPHPCSTDPPRGQDGAGSMGRAGRERPGASGSGASGPGASGPGASGPGASGPGAFRAGGLLRRRSWWSGRRARFPADRAARPRSPRSRAAPVPGRRTGR